MMDRRCAMIDSVFEAIFLVGLLWREETDGGKEAKDEPTAEA